jgi:hypothetical protein
LKSHQFFNGINWNDLPNQKPPIGDLTYNPKPVNLHSFSPNARKNCGLTPVKKSDTKKQDSLSDKEIAPFKITLIPIENVDTVIYESIYLTNLAIVQKKSPWLHYNTRILKLFSDGRLEYLDPKTESLKGCIRLDSTCKAIFNDELRFDLLTGSRKFIFKVIVL